MKGSSGVLVTILGAIVLMAMVGGYLLLQDSGPSSGKARGGTASDHDADAAADKARQDRDGQADAWDINRRANRAMDPDDPEGKRATRAGTGAEGTGPTNPDDLPATATVNPDEINEVVPGHLIVRVVKREDERPLPGTTVYFPLRGTRLETEGGEVSISDKLDAMVKRTNRHGVAVWSEKELAELIALQSASIEKQTSVLITALGYADVFEPLAIPDLKKGAEATFKLMPAVRITGKVREKRGGIVSYAKVEILQTNQQGDTSAPVNRFKISADGLGEFAIKLADTYLYVFEVQLNGYAPYKSRVFNFREDKREVSIMLESAKGISGVVADTGNKPIEGAEVWAKDDGLRVMTDADGKFTIDMVTDRIFRNDVNLRFSAKGYAPKDEKVLANDHNVKVNLDLEGTLTGVVVNDRGEKVAGATVRCTYVEGPNRYPWDSVLSGENGEFRFGGFSNGDVQVSAHLGDLYSANSSVRVAPRSNAGPVTLTLITGASITGRVHAGGIGIATVTLALDGKAAGATDADGAYNLGGIADGKHKVKIVNQFPIADEMLRQLPVFTTDGKTYYYLPTEREVTLKLADSVAVDFDVKPFDARIDRKITVNITTSPNEPATGVQVTIKPVYGQPPEGVEAPKTQVLARDLPEGKASMPLSLVNGVSYEATFVHNRFFEAKLTSDALAGVQDGGTIELVLERAFIIKGTVKDSQGNGLESVGLSRDKNNPWQMTATTDIYGYFEFGQLKAGEYTITAFKTSYYQEAKVVIIEGADPAPLDMTLVSANEIRIIVTNNGNPQAGAHVHIYRNDAEGDDPDDYKRHFDIGTTDANGEKYINFHWVRNYQIVAYWGSEVAFTNFNNLKEIPEREFSIELEAAYDLTGVVVDSENSQPLGGSIVRAHITTTGTEGRDGNFFQMQVSGDGRFNFKVPTGSFYFYVPKTSTHQSFNTEGSPVPAGTLDTLLPVPVREDIQGNYAQMVSMTVPSSMTAGQQYSVEVVVKNRGDTTWTAAGNKPWRLGSQSPQDNQTWGMGRVSIAAGVEVRPGETYSFQFMVTAPATAGTYQMQWRMVQDGKEWFGQFTEKRQITVTAPSPE